MGLFDFFSPKSFDVFEEKGDRLVRSRDLGLAKLEYEKALSRLAASSIPKTSGDRGRIEKKIQNTGESLAQQHKTTAEALLETGCLEEAGELLDLARVLTQDPQLKTEIDKLSADVGPDSLFDTGSLVLEETMDGETFDAEDEDAYFLILCSTLPDDVQTAYQALGENFKSGYIALNRGAFDSAAVSLNQALADQGEGVTYVHLELATVYLNLGDTPAARALLEVFIESYPESLRAYEALCEIYWESENYDFADRLLQACPDALKTSLPILLLMGETLFRSGKQEEAVSFYLKSNEYLGWNEPVAIALARTYEAMHKREAALATYQEVMAGCKSCHKQVNPFVRQRYADLSYEAGDISGGLLETYFSLCQEDPENQGQYLARISEIYKRQGHPAEAERYLKIARETALGGASDKP